MKKLHKKILIVFYLKIVEVLIVVACMAVIASALYGVAWLLTALGIVKLLGTIFTYVVLALVGLYILYFLGTMIREWFKWNWNKAERIITRNEE